MYSLAPHVLYHLIRGITVTLVGCRAATVCQHCLAASLTFRSGLLHAHVWAPLIGWAANKAEFALRGIVFTRIYRRARGRVSKGEGGGCSQHENASHRRAKASQMLPHRVHCPSLQLYFFSSYCACNICRDFQPVFQPNPRYTAPPFLAYVGGGGITNRSRGKR